jgi:hypothetical protein
VLVFKFNVDTTENFLHLEVILVSVFRKIGQNDHVSCRTISALCDVFKPWYRNSESSDGFQSLLCLFVAFTSYNNIHP